MDSSQSVHVCRRQWCLSSIERIHIGQNQDYKASEYNGLYHYISKHKISQILKATISSKPVPELLICLLYALPRPQSHLIPPHTSHDLASPPSSATLPRSEENINTSTIKTQRQKSEDQNKRSVQDYTTFQAKLPGMCNCEMLAIFEWS